MEVPKGRAHSFLTGLVLGILIFVVPYKGTYYFLQYKVYEKLYESEAFLTVISGVLIFVVSQFIREYYFESVHEYKKVMGQISSRLLFYVKAYSELQSIKPAAEYKEELQTINEAKVIIRDFACNLSASYEAVPNKRLLALFGLVRTEDQVFDAVNKMLQLSQLECYPSATAAIAAGVQASEVKIKGKTAWNEGNYNQNIRILNEICEQLGFYGISFKDFDITKPFD